MLAVGGKLGLGAAIQSIRPRRRLRKCVSADNFSAGQPRQIFLLLLFRAEVHDGERANAGVSAPGCAEAAVLRQTIGDDGGSDFIHLHAAVLFGNINAAQPKFSCLLHQFPGDGEVFVLHLVNIGNNFLVGEFFCGLRNEQVLLAEIFWSENILRRAFLDQEAAAADFVSRYCSNRSHILSPSKH